MASKGAVSGLPCFVDPGQERHRLFGLIEKAVALGEEEDALLVLGQRGGQLGLAALEAGDDPFELAQRLARSSARVAGSGSRAWACLSFSSHHVATSEYIGRMIRRDC